MALEAGAASVRTIDLPTSWPRGWDLADVPPEGVTADDLKRMVRAHASTPEKPVPLLQPVPPSEPYPTSGLGEDLAPVVDALHEIVQSPVALCANSVLATITLAAQAHINVELPIGGGVQRPVSEFYLTVGRSGERKSATDEQAMPAVRAREAQLREDFDKQMKVWRDRHDAWEAARRKILLGKGDATSKRADLARLGDEPERPLTPIIVMEEPTIEGLAKLLTDGQPSVGVFSAEGGQFIGGHAMSDDAKLRSSTALSTSWDGGPWKRVRSGDGATTIPDRRVSMHLLVQPDVATQFLNDRLLRDQGLLSRLLVTSPATTMGTRALPEAFLRGTRYHRGISGPPIGCDVTAIAPAPGNPQ